MTKLNEKLIIFINTTFIKKVNYKYEKFDFNTTEAVRNKAKRSS